MDNFEIEVNELVNRMARFISKLDIDESICKYNHIGEDCEENENDCVECIIRHFMKGE